MEKILLKGNYSKQIAGHTKFSVNIGLKYFMNKQKSLRFAGLKKEFYSEHARLGTCYCLKITLELIVT